MWAASGALKALSSIGNLYRGDRFGLATGQLFHTGGHHCKQCVRGFVWVDDRTFQCQLGLFHERGIQQRAVACFADSERGVWDSRHSSRVHAPGSELLGRRSLQGYFLDRSVDQFTTREQNGYPRPDSLFLCDRNGHDSAELPMAEKRLGDQRRDLLQLHNTHDYQHG